MDIFTIGDRSFRCEVPDYNSSLQVPAPTASIKPIVVRYGIGYKFIFDYVIIFLCCITFFKYLLVPFIYWVLSNQNELVWYVLMFLPHLN